MACPTHNVYLGPLGTELLPVVKYVGGAPDFPTTIDPQTEEARMSNGSRGWAFFSGCTEWGLGWGYLTLAQLNTLQALVNLKQILKFQNNFVDATVHDVVIVAFSCEPVFSGIRGYHHYKADMTLRQA